MARVGGNLRVVDGEYAAGYEGTDDRNPYDPDGFYVDSTNKHNHKAETRVGMKPEIHARIMDLIASGELKGTPIKSYQSFMRDAAHHNLERIGRLIHSPDLLAFAAQQRHLAAIDQAAEQTEALRKIVADADERLNAATKSGDQWFVDHLVTMYEAMLSTMREPYATDLEDVLRDARRWLKARTSG